MVLLLFAFWNSVFRLSVLIDGKGSDEYKLSKILDTAPYLFQIVSIIICAVLIFLISKKQRFFKPKKLLWIIPLGWVGAIIAYRVSFGLIGLVF